jgi:hypothetical protein
MKPPQEQLEYEWAIWLHSLASWSVMVTLTFKRCNGKGGISSQSTLEDALKHLVRLINCDFFGKRRTNKGWTVACAVILDYGTYGDHPHAHLLIEAPKGVSDEKLCMVIDRAANRTCKVNRQRHFRSYTDLRGSQYLVKHGIDRMVTALLTHAYPSK